MDAKQSITGERSTDVDGYVDKQHSLLNKSDAMQEQKNRSAMVMECNNSHLLNNFDCISLFIN